MSRLPLRVIVLEDHKFQRSVAVKMLQAIGCNDIFEASDGAEALEILRAAGPVDVALCDLQMDGMDGLEFLQKAGAAKLVSSIIISSSLSEELRRAVYQIVSLVGLKLLGDLGKPLHLDPLQLLLKKYLNSANEVAPIEKIVELESESEVIHAITAGQLHAYYQPKFNLETFQVCGVEVLCRWLHPERGVISPALFMPILEQCGLMNDLLSIQMRQALSLQRLALSQGFDLNFAFNLQASQLASAELTKNIKSILSENCASGSNLTFELTETGLLDAPATCLESLVRLRMMGCRLSIDDFGAGFSSMQRLCQVPFNEIKLDREFVHNLEKEPRCRAVISSTVALGKALGMSVVVEGIETDVQRKSLIELGCSYGQGYWYARPMDGSDFMAWLARQGNG